MSESRFLEMDEVLAKIEEAIENRKPFSLVRIGDGENIVLAQSSVWTLKEVLAQPWAKRAIKGDKGIDLPDLTLRDLMVESIRKANVVRILPFNDTIINAPESIKRPLTEKIFSYFQLKPDYTCHAWINRKLFSY